ncbi:hypothetical protein Efla_003273 [Eimeria flavescens]
MQLGGGVLLFCGWVLLLFKYFTRKAMAPEEEGEQRSSCQLQSPLSVAAELEGDELAAAAAEEADDEQSCVSYLSGPPSPVPSPPPPTPRRSSRIRTFSPFHHRQQHPPVLSRLSAAATAAAPPAAAAALHRPKMQRHRRAEESPVSKREALQHILTQVYTWTGDRANLLDVETEARLLTGEVFADERILSKEQAWSAIREALHFTRRLNPAAAGLLPAAVVLMQQTAAATSIQQQHNKHSTAPPTPDRAPTPAAAAEAAAASAAAAAVAAACQNGQKELAAEHPQSLAVFLRQTQ